MASGDAHEYVLGHSAEELKRLRRQAQLLNPITRRYLMEAGIAPGMSVLDVGSGVGDVAFLAAELVGPSGHVVGVDRSPDALVLARSRAKEQSTKEIGACRQGGNRGGQSWLPRSRRIRRIHDAVAELPLLGRRRKMITALPMPNLLGVHRDVEDGLEAR